jgi:xanthine dehydrogenase YagS FAD-binding subunit
MRPFEYRRPATMEEALELLAQDGDTQLLAGGTDLLTLMKADIAQPQRLLDVKRLEGLPRGIQESEGGLTIGALTTLSEIERSSLIQHHYPALAQAASIAATPQLRNMATLGGNLLQRPRCWYFRSTLFHCWLKGGDTCHAREGQNQHHALFHESPCVAAHPSDLAPVLVALGAEVHLRSPTGERHVLAREFFTLPVEERRQETMIEPNELVLGITLPRPREGTRSIYLKAMERNVWAFALVSVAAVVQAGGNAMHDARLVLGGVAPIPWLVEFPERGIGQGQAAADWIEQIADEALATAQPLQHNGYKMPLARSLIRRALAQLVE